MRKPILVAAGALGLAAAALFFTVGSGPTDTGADAPAIEWPMSWEDRGAVRRFNDTRNYPAAAPGIVYARQIAELLDYPIERVLKYHALKGPGGRRLPGFWRRDRYDSYYCTEAQAVQIVARIRYHRTRSSPAT